MSNNWFGSHYYNALYDHRNEDEAALAVKHLMAYLQPPVPSRMYDIACGEGRFARQLALYGHEVLGIDLSQEKISKAQTFQTERLQFRVQDMRQTAYIRYFDYAFNFFTSFGYFAKAHDNELAARAFAASLKKDGILVMDYLNVTYSRNTLLPRQLLHKNGFDFCIEKKFEEGYFIKDITVSPDTDQALHFRERVAGFELPDFKRLFCKNAGLSLMATFGDYMLNDFNSETSPRLIMLFKKEY